MMSEIFGTSWMVALLIISLDYCLLVLTGGRLGLFDYKDELNFDRRVERERVDADGGADVLAGVAEQLEQELAGAVGDLWLGGEVRVAGNERADAEDPAHLAERHYGGDGCDGVDHALAVGGAARYAVAR